MTSRCQKNRKRLVTRRNDPEDRRTRVVHLTPEGRKLIECAIALHAGAMESATAGLSPSERNRAIELLKKLGRTAAADDTPGIRDYIF